MVPFAGYELPLHYRDGILREHQHTRGAAGLFDVSHMGQFRLTATPTGNLAALMRLAPIDIADLPPGSQRYTLLTNDAGGVEDDLMVTRMGDHLFLVVNAARKAMDLDRLRAGLGSDCMVETLDDRALLALQGPAAAAALAALAPSAPGLGFMSGAWFTLDGSECYVTRSGYTGEDGFEISVPAAGAERLARRLLERPDVAPAGLGARDSLRLEAGMCLYGHDLDAATTPVEAGLDWAIPKSRRDAAAVDFPGATVIRRQIKDGVARRRVGLLPEGKAPVREGAALCDAAGNPVGRVTSGGFSPTLNRPIAMAYVERAHAAPGTALIAVVRDRPLQVKVARLPFVSPLYHRAAKGTGPS